ncbi:hypothetical protein AB0M54_21380 [Actinoplanes sp. NPDC051470]|uniref:hypothetical protein n=1 Tax=unclassified Actinoplanes TaxID=2626549 RepID=UPI00343F6BA6
MILLMLLTLVLGGLVVFAAWCAVRDGFGKHTAKAKATPRVEVLPSAPGSLEGVLAAQLAHGEITRGQYRRAMSQIAAREEERRPMSVPTDD